MKGLLLRLSLVAACLVISTCAADFPLGGRGEYGTIRVEYHLPERPSRTLGDK